MLSILQHAASHHVSDHLSQAPRVYEHWLRQRGNGVMVNARRLATF